ncbi:transposase [Ktedonobacter racemifer]|uniref:transposase n=1 Tax=Ktedonobacter racemifer TaxID=363277 RepID=UPI00146E8827|nr:transposase [Ktedonobacter racemifer]
MSVDTVDKSNSHIVFNCHYHVVWCPKYRHKVLVSPLDERLKVLIQEGAEK